MKGHRSEESPPTDVTVLSWTTTVWFPSDACDPEDSFPGTGLGLFFCFDPDAVYKKNLI